MERHTSVIKENIIENGERLVKTYSQLLNVTSYFKNGKYHRHNKPAIIREDCEKYYCDGKLHRKDGPAVISEKSKMWYEKGRLHRVDGPAIEYKDKPSSWYIRDELHRFDGPARILQDGTELWYHRGRFMNDNEVKQRKLELLG
jgi:hypothetical protein